MRGEERTRRAMAGWKSAIVATLIGCLIAGAAPAAPFSVTPQLRPQVDFWIAIFATYSRYQNVIHDTEHLDRVYAVLDYRDLQEQGVSAGQIDALMRSGEEAEKARIRAMLYRLQEDPDPATLTAEELRLRSLFAKDASPTKYLDAAASDRIRGQRGLRERFAQGIAIAHAYFPYMEEIFRRNGVPVEITRLPLVESTFNMKAYSKVGAAGVWQFMPGTARHFMRVDNVVDERLDPLVATGAAATFMRQNYTKLGTWPLAIKAYNHGPAGMARAVRDTGTTDIATIIRTYKGPAFKFASRNFYPEFLAAVHVERNHAKYFGDLELHPPVRSESLVLSSPISITTAARCLDGDVWTVTDLNPSLLPPVRTGRVAIPGGFTLRVPAGSADRFRRCAASVPATQMARRATERRNVATRGRTASTARVHRVKRGQTLSSIAARYGCTIDQIRRGNGMKSKTVKTGQLLRIPPC